MGVLVYFCYNEYMIHTKLFKDAFIFLCIVGFLNYIGDTLYLFDSIPGYDVVLHLLGGSLIAMAVFIAWDFFKLPKLSRNKMILVTILIALVIGIVWECYELYFGITFLSDGARYFADTAKDLTMDLVGGFFGFLWATHLLKKFE